MKRSESTHTVVPRSVFVAELIILFIFVAYWVLTGIYVSPNNFVRAFVAPRVPIFEALFYQRWEFFAPPPTFNFRLYAIPALADDKPANPIDLMSDVLQRKRARAPLNGPEVALDYILFGAAMSIDNSIHDIFAQTKQSHPESSEVDCLKIAREEFAKHERSDRNVLVLRNYAVAAVEKHMDLAAVRTIQIQINKVLIPRFSKAMKHEDQATAANVEFLAYQTRPIPLNH